MTQSQAQTQSHFQLENRDNNQISVETKYLDMLKNNQHTLSHIKTDQNFHVLHELGLPKFISTG